MLKIENTVKIMKEIHKDSVIIVKVGTFCRSYGKDAIMLSYMFDYMLKKNDMIYECGFPNTSITKIIMKLEEMNISYLIVNKSDNYEVEAQENYGQNNKYIECYNKANKYINRKNRINEIYNYFIENINDDEIKQKIMKVEEILYEV